MNPRSPSRPKSPLRRLLSRLAPTVCLIGSTLFSPASARPASSTTGDSEQMCVMTFNLRFASATPPNTWADRRPVVQACLASYAPDLIGTQEGLYHQIKDIAVDLPAYGWIGMGRDGGSRGEFMAIFYRQDRFEPLEFDHFWLSDTPSVIASVTWNHAPNRRMVTWAKFLDRRTDQLFYFINTHFDHAVAQARVNAAHLLLRKIEELDPNLPILLVGDFNAVAGSSEPFDILVNQTDFVDTRDAATTRRGAELNTFHGYREGPHNGGRRIDWILSRGPVVSEANEIITLAKNGQFPSDHFPVATWLRISPQRSIASDR